MSIPPTAKEVCCVETHHEEMERDENVILLGEDVGVMGNVFAITDRVIDTPIRESGFTVGAAMRGLRHVVERMYDDF